MEQDSCAIIGAGLIGRAWAMVFARAGWRVRLYDSDPAQLARRAGRSPRASPSSRRPGSSTTRPRRSTRIAHCDASRMRWRARDGCRRTCPRIVDVKRARVSRARRARAPRTRSSRARRRRSSPRSSPPTSPGRARCLVAHPVNPPHLVPVVELCGAPWTSPATLAACARGDATTWARCRCSCAARSTASSSTACRARCCREAMRLVGDGYVSPEDLDSTVARRPRPALVVHGPVRDDRVERARRRRRLLRALRRLYRRLAADPAPPDVWDARNVGARRGRARRAAVRAERERTHGAGATARLPALRGHKRDRSTNSVRRRTTMAATRKVIITCAVTGSIHTPSMSPHLPVTPRGDRRRRGRRSRGRRGDRAPARARPGRRPADAGPEMLPRVRARRSRKRCDVVHQLHDRRRRDDDDRGAPAARAAAQARGRLAQHGLDELRALSDARALHATSSTTGSASTSQASDDRDLQEHVQGHRVHPDLVRGQRHALRDRVLRHRPPVHRARTSSSAGWSSRRCSSRACSASWAASARIRTTSRT